MAELEWLNDIGRVDLDANPGTEPFYRDLGFLRMNTAMGIWRDRASALRAGLLSETGQ